MLREDAVLEVLFVEKRAKMRLMLRKDVSVSLEVVTPLCRPEDEKVDASAKKCALILVRRMEQ